VLPPAIFVAVPTVIVDNVFEPVPPEVIARGVVHVAAFPEMLPVTISEVPVAAPMFGVVSVGVFCKTTDPEPVAVDDDVPPFAIGRIPVTAAVRDKCWNVASCEAPFEIKG
jgi:hypothetical protein